METWKRKFTWIGHALRNDNEEPSKVCFRGILKETNGGGGVTKTQLEEIHSERSWKKLE
jgi:hypothetical protein